jgi:hypothetical protein
MQRFVQRNILSYPSSSTLMFCSSMHRLIWQSDAAKTHGNDTSIRRPAGANDEKRTGHYEQANHCDMRRMWNGTQSIQPLVLAQRLRNHAETLHVRRSRPDGGLPVPPRLLRPTLRDDRHPAVVRSRLRSRHSVYSPSAWNSQKRCLIAFRGAGPSSLVGRGRVRRSPPVTPTIYLPVYVTCHTERLPSSVTNSEPSGATATPTGLPQTCPSFVTKPVRKSSYSPVALPSFMGMRITS